MSKIKRKRVTRRNEKRVREITNKYRNKRHKERETVSDKERE